MSKSLIILFVKNAIPGRVKTRLAQSIGDQTAFEIYKTLVNITRDTVRSLKFDKQVYFSETIESQDWEGFEKHVQQGSDLGERMQNAFQKGFKNGYERIVLIGSDLPDINTELIKSALENLKQNDLVFGPAEDGGYYLIGMSQLHTQVFQNKAWSTSNLLKTTLNELRNTQISYTLLETLNDIDTFADLRASSIYKTNKTLQQKIEQYHG